MLQIVASLTDNITRVNYDHNMFIIQATGHSSNGFGKFKIWPAPLFYWPTSFNPTQGPGHAMAIPALPPVAEESVTVQVSRL